MTREIVVMLAFLVVACGGSERDGEPTAPPSGSLGPVTRDAADEAVLGLCEIAGGRDLETASATFQDRSHQTLHVIAAAAETVDRAAAADLLAAKQRVEADLSAGALPDGFRTNVEALLVATRAALGVIGLDAAACPA